MTKWLINGYDNVIGFWEKALADYALFLSSPVDPADTYAQCDSEHDAIYSNDPTFNYCNQPDNCEEDVYIVPDAWKMVIQRSLKMSECFDFPIPVAIIHFIQSFSVIFLPWVVKATERRLICTSIIYILVKGWFCSG